MRADAVIMNMEKADAVIIAGRMNGIFERGCCGSLFNYAQSRAEEICRKGGERGARRVVEKLFRYSI